MEIPIQIEKHCIETETKRLYERLLSRYFGRAGADQDKVVLENQIDDILFFLEHADFGALRNRHVELDGTLKNQVFLKVDQEGRHLSIHCGGKDVSVPFLENPKGLHHG